MTNWDERFFELALLARSWVKGPDLGVGAVIVSPDKRSFSLGYSGPARGLEDTAERLSDPSEKDFYVVHAEANAILNSPFATQGCSMFVTSCCCHNCALLIAQAGITRVVGPMPDRKSRWLNSQVKGLQIFKEKGIEHEAYTWG